jgi:arylsulfatase A-like enzyme
MTGPGVPAGARRDALCYLIDVFPTLCDLTGCPTPPSVEGHSLRPLLDDATASHREVLRFAYQDVQRSVRDRRYKLIEYAVENSLTRQLFDCVQDPGELHNLANDPAYSERLQALSGELERWRTELDDWGDAFWAVREESEREA